MNQQDAIRRELLLPYLLPLVVALGSCAVANHAIRAGFIDYNAIIQFNQVQQMLLNLVRLHYREPPMFLQAGSLSAAYESRASALASVSWESGVSTTSGVGVDYVFAAKPTITYTPIEGKAYTTQFMSPISLETFGLLVRSGWPVSRLAELLIEKVTLGSDLIQNDPQAASYPRFTALIATLQQAQDAGRLGVVTEKGVQVVRVGKERYPTEAWELRSLFDVMFAAAHNTQTPPEYRDRVRQGTGNGTLSIHVGTTRPADAMVWVEHDGYWYSIDNTDVKSKDTFALLMQLARIQSSPVLAQPMLTLPVR